MKCNSCKQTYCEGTEGDVMIHDHTCQLFVDFNQEKQRREELEKAFKVSEFLRLEEKQRREDAEKALESIRLYFCEDFVSKRIKEYRDKHKEINE